MADSNPPVVSLLNPERSLVVCFTDKGAVTVSLRVLQADGRYAPTVLGDLPQTTTPMEFEFGVDAPAMALMVEMEGFWSIPWDEERVSVLGGPPFAFGNGPVGVPGNFDPKLHTRRVHRGTFSYAVDRGAELTVTGLYYTAQSQIPPGIPAKYLSLWLPNGASGYVKFSNWEGKDVVFRSA